jgi:hypothetical protein
MILDAFAYWVREHDVDGFRIDAAWGAEALARILAPAARRPSGARRPPRPWRIFNDERVRVGGDGAGALEIPLGAHGIRVLRGLPRPGTVSKRERSLPAAETP